MKKLLLITLALLLCFTCFGCATQPTADTPETAPVSEPVRGSLDLSSFAAEDFDGNIQSGEVFGGHKLTMLNIWATFCGPCINEMPDLEKLSQSYGDEFQLIGIPVDVDDLNGNIVPEMRAEADAILELTGVTYLQLLPSRSLNELYLSGVQVFPTTLFFDENGIMLDEEYYGSRSLESWKAIVDGYLEALQ